MANSFVHCNQCYCRPTRETEFFLTSCGHLFCASCICKDSLGNGVCTVCNTGFNRMKLTRDMTDEVKMYFNDPLNMLNKAVKVFNFQKGHLQRYVSHCEVQMKKYRAENIRFRKRDEQMMRALAQKDREIQQLKGNRSVNSRMFMTQPTATQNEQFNEDEFVSPFARQTQPMATSTMYSQPSFAAASQRFKVQSRLSLDPMHSRFLQDGKYGYFRRQNTESPMSSVNMKSMSASSGSTYFSADRGVSKKSAKVSPFPPSGR